jgi:hypothetical protein
MQVAGATMLLTLTALLMRSAMITADANLGFDSEHTVVLEIDPASHGYGDASAQRFVADAVRRLTALPGVVSASFTDRVPFYVGFPARVEVSVDGRSCALEDCPTAATYRVGPGYFRTMNISVTAGRDLETSAGDGQSAVISETAARAFWPSRDPLGQWLTIGAEGRRVQIVGVAGEVIHRVVGERREPYIYLPYDQTSFDQPVAILIRTTADPQSLLQPVAEQIRAMDANLPIYRLRTMEQRIEARQQAGNLTIVKFFETCATLALFLSIVGLAGTVSYSVRQRHREFGIRAAIGAAPFDQARLVVVGALWMAGPGIAAGLFAALLCTWFIAGRASGLHLDSPMMFAVVGLIQVTIAIVAASIAGRRASSANPGSVLRAD